MSCDCSASQGQKTVSDPMELGLQVVVSHDIFMLVTKLGSPRRATMF